MVRAPGRNRAGTVRQARTGELAQPYAGEGSRAPGNVLSLKPDATVAAGQRLAHRKVSAQKFMRTRDMVDVAFLRAGANVLRAAFVFVIAACHQVHRRVRDFVAITIEMHGFLFVGNAGGTIGGVDAGSI